MSRYGRVSGDFWTSPTIRSMSPEAKILALYLISTPHAKAIGCYYLPLEYAAADLGTTLQGATKAMLECEAKGFAAYCPESSYVVIRKALKHDLPQGKNNMVQHYRALLAELPDDVRVLTHMAQALETYAATVFPSEIKELRQRIEGASKGVGSPSGTPPYTPTHSLALTLSPTHSKPLRAVEAPSKPLPSTFESFWAAWPKSARKVAKAKCAEHWKRNGLDALADLIGPHLNAMRDSQQWRDGFEPSPLTYLRQKRWEDDLPPLAKVNGSKASVSERRATAAAEVRQQMDRFFNPTGDDDDATPKLERH